MSFGAGMELSRLPKASSFKLLKVISCLHGLLKAILCTLHKVALWLTKHAHICPQSQACIKQLLSFTASTYYHERGNKCVKK